MVELVYTGDLIEIEHLERNLYGECDQIRGNLRLLKIQISSFDYVCKICILQIWEIWDFKKSSL